VIIISFINDTISAASQIQGAQSLCADNHRREPQRYPFAFRPSIAAARPSPARGDRHGARSTLRPWRQRHLDDVVPPTGKRVKVGRSSSGTSKAANCGERRSSSTWD
jgi:hypothetical protein